MDTEKQVNADIGDTQLAPASIQDSNDCGSAERALFAGRKTPRG